MDVSYTPSGSALSAEQRRALVFLLEEVGEDRVRADFDRGAIQYGGPSPVQYAVVEEWLARKAAERRRRQAEDERARRRDDKERLWHDRIGTASQLANLLMLVGGAAGLLAIGIAIGLFSAR